MFDASKGTLTITEGGLNPMVVTSAGTTVEQAFADQPVDAAGAFRNVSACVTGFTSAGAGRLTGPGRK